jgi:hypothetical protein
MATGIQVPTWQHMHVCTKKMALSLPTISNVPSTVLVTQLVLDIIFQSIIVLVTYLALAIFQSIVALVTWWLYL